MATIKTKKGRVFFKLEAPNAQKVILMGDFNKWNPKIHVMKKDKRGCGAKLFLLLQEGMNISFLWMGNGGTIPTMIKQFLIPSVLSTTF